MSFKKHKGLIIVLAFIVIICGVSYINYSWEKNGQDKVVITLSEDNENNDDKKTNQFKKQKDLTNEENELVVVHVCGAVIKPNKIYELKNGSRVADAVKLAGGCTAEADLTKINLAGIIKDGQKIYIPSVGEMNQQIDLIQKNNENQSINENNSLININTASKIELKQLLGIGEVKANSIIEYRNQNNGFKSIEEIVKVTGIGQVTYEKIKDEIIVN